MRIRPGGPAVVVAAAVVAALTVLVAILAVYLFTLGQSLALPALIPLVPSFLSIAFSLGWSSGPRRVLWSTLRASGAPPGMLLSCSGLRSAACDGAGRGGGGGTTHQLVADLRDGTTVIVWGVRNAAQHDRIVTGLIAATEAGLIPPTVARAHHFYRPGRSWPAN